MRHALHLGVQKALHQVDLEAISTGYVVLVGVDDEVAMNHVDALATPATNILAKDFMDFLFRMLPGGWPSSLKIVGRVVPFMFFVLVFGPSGHVINICCLKRLVVCEFKRLLFISAIALFCLPHFLG
jgi:hypothetical protein